MKDCYKFRTLISPYLDNQLTPDMMGKLKSHINECSDCKEIFDETESIVSMCGEIGEAAIPEDFQFKLMQNLTNINQKKGVASYNRFFIRRRFSGFAAIAATFVILIFAAGYAFNLFPSGNNLMMGRQQLSDVATPENANQKTALASRASDGNAETMSEAGSFAISGDASINYDENADLSDSRSMTVLKEDTSLVITNSFYFEINADNNTSNKENILSLALANNAEIITADSPEMQSFDIAVNDPEVIVARLPQENFEAFKAEVDKAYGFDNITSQSVAQNQFSGLASASESLVSDDRSYVYLLMKFVKEK